MAGRWQPKSPRESVEAALARAKARIKTKREELQELEAQAKQLEEAVKAMK